MPRLASGAIRSLHAAHVDGGGMIEVTARGCVRQLWFVGQGGGRNLQTEVVCAEHPGAGGAGAREPVGSCEVLDVRTSLRRTPYLHCMARRLACVRPRRVLVLGLGGGLLPRALHAAGAAEVVAVEHSAAVIAIARRYFGISEAERGGWLEVHHESAEAFVRAPTSDRVGFDACAIDLFEGHSIDLASCVLSSSFHGALRTMLHPGARVVQNTLGHSGTVVAGDPAGRVHHRGRRPGMVQCYAWSRNAAPRGPLSRAFFPRHNKSAEQMSSVERIFRQVFGNATVHTPCPWEASRVLEADVARGEVDGAGRSGSR